MDQSSQSQSPKRTFKQLPHTMVCLQQNISLPSNLLQKRKNILQQMRTIKTSQNPRINTARQPFTLMSKTFTNYRDVQRHPHHHPHHNKLQMLIQQVPLTKSSDKHKQKKNPLYRRLCDIQAESKELAGVSFSKLLSRMLVIQNQEKVEKRNYNDYRKKQYNTIDAKLRSIPNYQCLESKLFTIDCPQTRHHQSLQTSPKRSRNSSFSKTAQPQTNRLFKRYYNPHGQKTQFLSSMNQTIEFDERYIYKNGKKAECKRIHNFYTSNTFRKSYEKHMGNTIDSFYPANRSIQ